MTAEEILTDVIDVLVPLIEGAGALVIVIGATVALVRVVLVVGKPDQFGPIRLDLGRFVVLGIEFQLAGDLLRTAVAPSFTEIGQLGAIAAIRTVLNYFLRIEIRHEREELAKA